MKIKFIYFKDWRIVAFEIAIGFPCRRIPHLNFWISFLFWTFGIDFIFSKNKKDLEMA